MAEYYLGKTIDPDGDYLLKPFSKEREKDNFLKIEGERYPYIEKSGRFYYNYNHEEDGKKDFCKDLSVLNPKYSGAASEIELGKSIIEIHPTKETLEKERLRHIDQLKEGVKSWNDWRIRHPHVRPILYELNKNDDDRIPFKELQKANFSNANLINADLRGFDLTKANFHEANLGGASLIGATLKGANFCRTDLYTTDMSGANLTDANLQGAQIAKTKFKKINGKETEIVNCKVYGSSAWDIEGLEEATQKDLEIIYKIKEKEENTHLNVDDLGMAQFLYFILNNKNLSEVFKATNSSIVLILGRFTEERKRVLDRIRNELGDYSIRKKYIPIIFDFEKPEDRGYTEVITVLAGISRFIIADLTSPKSIPQELQAIIGGFRIPVIPIINRPDNISISNSCYNNKSETEPYSMFIDYFKYEWVHPVIEYSSEDFLFQHFNKLIYKAEEFYKQIMENRKVKMGRISIENLTSIDKL